MVAEDLRVARSALEKFEKEMGSSGALAHLQEGLDYIFDISEGSDSGPQSKQIAQNLLETYRGRLIKQISGILGDKGSFDLEFYLQWLPLIDAFQEGEIDEDSQLKQLKGELFRKAFFQLSKPERATLRAELEKP